MTFYTFANATTSIPLANLDANFATPITLGNTAVTINGTFSSIGNLTLNNANIASVAATFPNSYLANSTTTIGNTTVTLGSTSSSIGNLTLNNATIASGNSTVTKETVTTITSPAATNLTIQSAGTTAMTIDTSQNVGIGTSSPGAVLDVTKNQATTTALQVFNNNASGTASIKVGYDGTYHYNIFRVGNSADITHNATQATANLIWQQGGSERMRIDSSGNLLVGVTSGSNTKFRVQGADTSSSNYTAYFQDSAASNLFLVRNDGYISTGTSTFSPYNTTTASAANLFVGNTGGLARSTSSIRYKTDVQDATHGLADVMKLRSVTYKGKNDGDKLFGGFIAEEVDAAGLNEFVVYDAENRPDALHYGNMVALMAKAIQELKADFDAYKASHP